MDTDWGKVFFFSYNSIPPNITEFPTFFKYSKYGVLNPIIIVVLGKKPEIKKTEKLKNNVVINTASWQLKLNGIEL